MIITRKGSLIPSVLDASAGQLMYVVETLLPATSSTDDWMSPSVMRLMCPFWTAAGWGERTTCKGMSRRDALIVAAWRPRCAPFLSQICSGLEPML
jgi:hypothetical protein